MTHEPPLPPQLALSDIMHTMSPSPGPLGNEVDEDADAEGERDEGVEEPEHPRRVQEQSETEVRDDFGNGARGVTAKGKQRSASPEFVGLEEFLHMQKRALEIHSEMRAGGHGEGSARERELADMILRLTSSSSGTSNPAQLVAQADTISRLLAQRDFLIREAEEERAWWEAEREGWNRMAEALVAARGGSRSGSSATREELEKKRTWLESDNKALRFKLQDTQERLTTLESELSKLKPILLMQPFPTNATHTLASLNHSASFLASVPYPSVRGSGKMIQKFSARRKKDMKTTGDSTVAGAEDGTSPDPHPSVMSLNIGDHYRKSEVLQLLPSASGEVPSSSRKPSHQLSGPLSTPTLPSLPLASDARAEHLLLAARRIGRERTSIVAGIVRARQQELERERVERERAEREKDRAEREIERLERLKSGVSYYRKEGETKSVKTPKRVFVQWLQPPEQRPTLEQDPEGANQLSSPAVASPSNQGQTPGAVAQGQNQTHGSVHTPARQAVPAPSPNPHTPLDSLWNAAQSMMDDQPEAESSTMAKRSMLNGRRHASTMDQLESPVPKRRRVSKVLGEGANVNRMRSALDVLADQADQASAVGAGFRRRREIDEDDDMDRDNRATISEAASPEALQETRESRRGKGKGKGKEKDTDGEDVREATKPKATPAKRTRARAPAKEKRTASKSKPRASHSESAMPRMISPPALHRGRSRVLGQLYIPDGVSPTKTTPGRGGGPTSGRGRTRSKPDVIDTSFDEHARVSLRPVTGWGERGEEEEEDAIDTPARSQEIDGTNGNATDGPGVARREAKSVDDIVSDIHDGGASTQDGATGGDVTYHGATDQLEPGAREGQSADRPDQPSVIPPPTGLPTSPLLITTLMPPQLNGIVHGVSSLGGDADTDCDMDADGDVDAEGDPDPEELPEGPPEFLEHLRNMNEPPPTTTTISAIASTTLVPPPTFTTPSLITPLPTSATHLEPQAALIAPPHRTNTTSPVTTTTLDINQIVPSPSTSSPRSDARIGSPEPDKTPGRRGRTTYVKWTKEEDELLAEAVAKYGQKWELVQRDLPARGYHQVRQRWLGKLVAYDNNPDSVQPHPAFPRSGYADPPAGSQTPKPKLGLAPLKHELSFTSHIAPSTSALSTGSQN